MNSDFMTSSRMAAVVAAAAAAHAAAASAAASGGGTTAATTASPGRATAGVRTTVAPGTMGASGVAAALPRRGAPAGVFGTPPAAAAATVAAATAAAEQQQGLLMLQQQQHLQRQVHEYLARLPAHLKLEYLQAQVSASSRGQHQQQQQLLNSSSARSCLSTSTANSSSSSSLTSSPAVGSSLQPTSPLLDSPSTLEFLESEGWNAWTAALKIALYWKTRVELFRESNTTNGNANNNINNMPTRPFRPISLITDPEDFEVYSTGFLVSLSQSPNKVVFFCNPSRLWKNGGDESNRGILPSTTMMDVNERVLRSCLRCTFHRFDESITRRQSPTAVALSLPPPTSCTVLLLWKKSDQLRCSSNPADFLLVHRRVEQALSALPLGGGGANKSLRVVVCQGDDWDDARRFYNGTPQFNTSSSAAWTVAKVGASTRQEMARQLLQARVVDDPSALPVELGGTWRYDNFYYSFSGTALNNDANLASPSSGIASSSPKKRRAKTDRAGYSACGEDELSNRKRHQSGGALPGSNALPILPSSASAAYRSTENAAYARGLREMESAISLLPDRDKAALLEARRVAPELAEKEAPPLRFLLFEDYNAWDAARRLAAYWAARKRIFAERAFLPMNCTGEGTLSREDVTVLRSGYILLLPNDAHGRPVLCGDPARRGDHARMPRLRIAFYMFSILSENEAAQKEGIVLLAILKKRPHLDPTVREVSNLVLDTLPLRVHRTHLVCPPLHSNTTFLESLVPLCLKLFGPFIKKRASVHVTDTKEELFEKLKAVGLRETGLPECIGGKWSYEQFDRWQELRMCYEWELPVVGARSAAGLPCIPPYDAKPRSELNDEEKVERKRRLNVLHSRRKRERSRVEREVLSAQVNDLRESNERLAEENKRFEDLLRNAKLVIQKMPDSQQTESAAGTRRAAERLPHLSVTDALRMASAQPSSNCDRIGLKKDANLPQNE